jgi:hypothetical protein
MDEEEEDDMYAQDETPAPTGNGKAVHAPVKKEEMSKGEEDEEEGEEVEEDESDSVGFPIRSFLASF